MPSFRFWLIGLFAPSFWLVALCLLPGSTWAQFDKTPWPRTQSGPPIDLIDMNGQRWTPAELKGRVVVINFWATWCAPCKEEMPSLQALYTSDPIKPLVIGINVKESGSTVRRFLQAQQLTFPLVLDPQGEITRRWGVRVYPTTVLIGPDGQARWRVVGEVDWSGDEVASWLSDLQKPAKPTR